MTWEGLSPPYRTIVADPPWHYDGRPVVGQGRRWRRRAGACGRSPAVARRVGVGEMSRWKSGSPVQVFDAWAPTPTYHNPRGVWHDGVHRTACGQWWWQAIETADSRRSESRGELMRRSHLQQIGRPCRRCFPEGDR